MEIKKVLVIFKTHLDIGFTDMAHKVTDIYMNSFIPNAVRTARELRKKNSGARLIWTTGSWLIDEYLRTQSKEKAEELAESIKNGDICWHGLPFTTHTELIPAELFEYGLSISAGLDRRFSKKTVAAKMTDVPGHTKAIIPALRKSGIELLHIGVNPASAVPDVPPLFRWRADTGEEICVMYQGDYGEYSQIGDTGVAVCFAHTNDNIGVQTAEDIEEIFASLQKKLPEAEIVAASLNDLALAVMAIRDSLPVVTDEIGDTWIHGVGTDPEKVSAFRGLCRLYNTLPEGADKQTLARGLIMIPEHTWGLDEKVHLADNCNYRLPEFEAARKKPCYLKMEKSWLEQRNYLTDTVARLSEKNRKRALDIIAQAKRSPADISGLERVAAGEEITLKDYRMRFNGKGEIDFLSRNGKIFADSQHRLGTLIYEQFCEADYERFYNSYNRVDYDWSDAGFDWAREDFTKPGMGEASPEYRRYEPQSAEVYKALDAVIIKYRFSAETLYDTGCPAEFDLIIKETNGRLLLDLAWHEKKANRVAEALWFGMKPAAHNKKISKLGCIIDPKRVVNRGQSRLHATDFGAVYDELSIETVDTALIAPKSPSLLEFNNIPPEDSEAIYFNLYNNIWGTNFPMWYEEDARFRFILSEKE